MVTVTTTTGPATIPTATDFALDAGHLIVTDDENSLAAFAPGVWQYVTVTAS